jgi:ribonuclease E
MEAAFVDIRGRNGVLYAGEVNWRPPASAVPNKIEQALKPGDVVVQVSKDPVGHKGPG